MRSKAAHGRLNSADRYNDPITKSRP